MNPKISVVAPVFNEAGNLPEFHRRLNVVLERLSPEFEIVYINDGSVDNSMALIHEWARNDKRVKFLSFSRNFGHQVAASAGLENSHGDCVAIIDTDLQDPPELLEEMYNKYREGFRVVYAKRKQREGESAFKRMTANLFYRTLRSI